MNVIFLHIKCWSFYLWLQKQKSVNFYVKEKCSNRFYNNHIGGDVDPKYHEDLTTFKFLAGTINLYLCITVMCVCEVCSPSPWDISCSSGRSGRSARLSPWSTRASLRTSNRFNTTNHSWPIRRLYTSPYLSANCEWNCERRESMMLNLTDNTNSPRSIFYIFFTSVTCVILSWVLV